MTTQTRKPPAKEATPVAVKLTSAQLGKSLPVKTLRDVFKQLEPEFQKALPRHMDPRRFFRLALTQLQKTPKLIECRASSIIAAMMECAQLGLELDGVLGHAWLVPFKGVAQLIVGYKGFVVLAMDSGRVAQISTRVVYARDDYEIEQGTNEWILHLPRPPSADAEGNEPVAFYSVAQIVAPGGDVELVRQGDQFARPPMVTKFEWMWRAEVEAIKARAISRNPQSSSPWKHPEDWIEMGKKTPLRRMCKTLGLSANLTRAAAADELREISDTPIEVDLELPDEVASAQANAQAGELVGKYSKGAEVPPPVEHDGEPEREPGDEP